MLSNSDFLDNLNDEIQQHIAVTHPLLARISQVPFTREDYLVFGLQHYPLVGKFTSYMEHLLLRAPDSDTKQWLAKVLVDEYGEGSDNKDHATLYFEFLQAAGLKKGQELQTTLHPFVTDFIKEHMRIVTQEPFLVGLGAVGPGHEWAIPTMFPYIVRGLRNAGFKEEELLYFSLHMEQDIDHGTWLREALLGFTKTQEDQDMIRRGTLLSLEARSKFWFGVQNKIVRWRQPKKMHLRKRGQKLDAQELTLKEFQLTI